jgi:hypothetical protein
MTEAKNPTKGNAIKATLPDPKRPKVSDTIAELEKMIKTFLLSKIFKSNNPRRQPIVINPQKFDTTLAPKV